MRIVAVVALAVGVPVAAYGYTDPGTGAFAYQALMAAVMGLVWTGRRIARRLFSRADNKTTQE